jgi:hypothetical protein
MMAVNNIFKVFDNANLDGFYYIIGYPTFNYTFTLTNAIGQCTKNQVIYDPYNWPFDHSQIEYCLCCGEYNPDPALNCPTNPWARA